MWNNLMGYIVARGAIVVLIFGGPFRDRPLARLSPILQVVFMLLQSITVIK
jgi:hypothetical protein